MHGYMRANRLHRARFLSETERTEVQRRLREDTGHLSNEFNMKYVWQAVGDWKIYIHMLICMAGFCPIYSIALFLPTIIKNMGYTSNTAQLMSVPPYCFACIFTIAASWYADRVRQRGIFLLGFQLVGILGFGLLVGTSKSSAQYAGTILAAIGTKFDDVVMFNEGN
jgi:cyanate permease